MSIFARGQNGKKRKKKGGGESSKVKKKETLIFTSFLWPEIKSGGTMLARAVASQPRGKLFFADVPRIIFFEAEAHGPWLKGARVGQDEGREK